MNPEGLRPASDFADAVWHEMARPRLVTIANGGFNVHDPERYDNVYIIGIAECTERDDILKWVRQLSEKRWVTVQVIEDFARALIHHFGVNG
jgi:hypothetical protein